MRRETDNGKKKTSFFFKKGKLNLSLSPLHYSLLFSLTDSSASCDAHTALISAQLETGKIEKATWSAWKSICFGFFVCFFSC